MSVIELFILAIGLSMDAFAVSVCKGLAIKKIKFKDMMTAGLWFGAFQALMPMIGYILGTSFSGYIKAVDHWIAFVLLVVIGANMIKEALSDDGEDEDASMSWRAMFPLAIATSIDALAVGVTLAFLDVKILPSACSIGLTTFIISAAGIKIGNIFGARYKSKAEIVGGVLLILLGIKILAEHLLG